MSNLISSSKTLDIPVPILTDTAGRRFSTDTTSIIYTVLKTNEDSDTSKKKVVLGFQLEQLESSIDNLMTQFLSQRPLRRSPELHELARRAVIKRQETEHEDVDAWAHRIANDNSNFTD